jgi:ribosomal protein L37AE/L43A
MGNTVQSKIKSCSCCGHKTVHNRNAHVMSGGMVLLHLLAVVMTAGFWLIYLAFATMMRGIFTGSWICSKCGK